jgi:hypothetical protein
MQEIWKTIEEFPKYEVSSQGKVRNIKTGRVLKTSLNNKGYKQVNLGKSLLVHRLVCLTFLPNKSETVNHIDGDKFNNNVSNLEWCTNEYNQKQAWENGLYDGRKKMCLDLRTGVYYDTASNFSRAKGMNRSTLHKHLVNIKDYGFDVKYV